MPGAYCKYCGQRCFVLRTLPTDAPGPMAGKSLHLATCARGMAHDREATGGYDHTNTTNPLAPAGT